MVIPPLALVTPVPLSVPPDQAVAPVTVTVSLPVRVPLLCVKELVVIAFPVEKFRVPPDRFKPPTFVNVAGLVKLAVAPLLAVVAPVTLYVPV